MSQEQKSSQFRPSAYEAKPSELQEIHHATTFEESDANAKLVIWSLTLIAATLVIIFAITIGIQKFLADINPPGAAPSPLTPGRVLAPKPQLEPHPWEELPELRAHEEQVLHSYGKSPDGHTHIPIDRAMDAIVSRLPVRPDTPQGLTTPGGEGRDFAGSVNAMPAPYRRPRIQGEIHKHAQP
jgi:hypothetical protein